jgi:hypothetical protein
MGYKHSFKAFMQIRDMKSAFQEISNPASSFFLLSGTKSQLLAAPCKDPTHH